MVTVATITYKNQLTLPQELVEKTKLKNVKKVLIETQGENLLIKPLLSSVKSLSGSLDHLAKKHPIKPRNLRKEVQKRVAEQIAKEGW